MAQIPYIRTPEIRKKVSEALKLSYIRNPENLVKASLRKLGKKMPKEFGEKISKANKGRKLSAEHIANRTKAQKGIKRSLEFREKLSEANKGDKCNFWKGGVSQFNRSERKRITETFEYKLWRESVFKRDNYTCRFCNERGGTLQADHIKPFALYPELRFAIDNGRTLCVKCHMTTDTWGGNSMKKHDK